MRIAREHSEVARPTGMQGRVNAKAGPAGEFGGEPTLLAVPSRQRSSEPVVSFDPEALHRLRVQRDLSLDRLAERVGAARPQLIAYEKGRRGIGVGMLVELAAALKVEPIELTTTRLQPEQATFVELRQAKGLSRKELAARLGLAEKTWDAIERGYRSLTPDTLASVARALDMTQDAVAAAHQRGVTANRVT